MATSDNPSLSVPKETKQGALTDIQIEKALRAHNGLMTYAAEQLGVTRTCISGRVAISQYLKDVIADCVETRLDLAEQSLTTLTKQRDLGSLCFTLKTIGKKRGYTEHDISKELDQMKVDLKALAEALGAGRAQRVEQAKDHTE